MPSPTTAQSVKKNTSNSAPPPVGGSGGYGPNANPSGSDPRGVGQNQSQYQQNRFEQQQGPLANLAGYNYGRASETGFNDYNANMGNYQGFLNNGGGIQAGSVGYSDPYNSYGGYQNFAQTGGYSPADIANLRSRGASPVRAAYANAEREVSRQRALQGGYSPNATATLAKMAREQSQSGADAMQNVEAGLATARNQGRLAGMAGMKGIEDQRLGAQLDAGKFNAQQQYLASAGNANNQLQAMQGMTSLYGASPGMANVFGNQALSAMQTGGQFGNTLYGNDIANQRNDGQFEQTMNRTGSVLNTIGDVTKTAAPIYDAYQQRQRRNNVGGSGGYQPGVSEYGANTQNVFDSNPRFNPNDPYGQGWG